MDDKPAERLKPLKITCTSSDCNNDLHCFRRSRKMAAVDRGKCRSCGKDLIDWPRVHERELRDAAFIFNSLKQELIRHHYWHKPIDQHAENYARRKGRVGLKEAVRKRLKKSVAPANPPFDGRQTPHSGNIIYYAQHATACCCRTCMEYWPGIPKGVGLDDEQLDYFVNLIMLYVDERLPDLSEFPQKVAPIRTKSEDYNEEKID